MGILVGWNITHVIFEDLSVFIIVFDIINLVDIIEKLREDLAVLNNSVLHVHDEIMVKKSEVPQNNLINVPMKIDINRSHCIILVYSYLHIPWERDIDKLSKVREVWWTE